MSTELAVRDPARDIHSAWVSMALSPLGLVASVVVMFVISAALGLPILTAGDQVIAGGGSEPTALGTLLLLLGGVGTALALPVRALLLSVRAHRAGHERASTALAASISLLVVVIALPFIWNLLATGGPG